MTTYKIIGVNTGNSLDAVDGVLTEFDGNKITDLADYSVPYPRQLREDFLEIRKKTGRANGHEKISMDDLAKWPLFQQAHEAYIRLVAQTIKNLLNKAYMKAQDITAIGFHGQTLDHYPPSVAQSDTNVFTLQVGSGQALADLTGIPVIYDFRSDDIMNGGEAAPLSPIHNKNIARSLGLTDTIFYNAGNTGNVAIISGDTVIGWDAGPFNDFADKMVFAHTHGDECYDKDAKYGLRGSVDEKFLKILFDNSAIAADGKNYLDFPPPKSSDPSWYKLPDELSGDVDFETKIRTVEYFAAYVAVYSLKFVPQDIKLPPHFVLFGGGWNNPVCRQAFEDLLTGKGMILPEHKEVFDAIIKRFDMCPHFEMSHLSQFMEARLFADLARYFLEGKTWFSKPLKSGHKPVVLGVRRAPNQGPINDQINRASKGWQLRKTES